MKIRNCAKAHVYWSKPEFLLSYPWIQVIPFLQEAELRTAVELLQKLDETTIGNILAPIPSVWDLSGPAKTALKELILQRAKYVADTIVDRIQSLC